MTKKTSGFVAKHHLTRAYMKFLEYLESNTHSSFPLVIFFKNASCVLQTWEIMILA